MFQAARFKTVERVLASIPAKRPVCELCGKKESLPPSGAPSNWLEQLQVTAEDPEVRAADKACSRAIANGLIALGKDPSAKYRYFCHNCQNWLIMGTDEITGAVNEFCEVVDRVYQRMKGGKGEP